MDLGSLPASNTKLTAPMLTVLLSSGGTISARSFPSPSYRLIFSIVTGPSITVRFNPHKKSSKEHALSVNVLYPKVIYPVSAFFASTVPPKVTVLSPSLKKLWL